MLSGDDPFDESTMLDEDADEGEPATRRPADESTAPAAVPA
ncbi:hypothetical protein [Micromonospora sp. 4G55]|nr:hypothetical protein [Micromonospora sp. 4G55]